MDFKQQAQTRLDSLKKEEADLKERLNLLTSEIKGIENYFKSLTGKKRRRRRKSADIQEKSKEGN